jgi:hypothetical protein
MRSPVHPAERLEITDVHSLAAIVARDPQFPERRRRLMRLVAGTVGVCALILVAAGVGRLLHPPPSPAAMAPITITENPGTAPAAPVATVDPTPAPPPPAPTTGTLQLRKPALAGHVWLDGKKLSQADQAVACGKHKVKVGTWGHTHPVDVPCGGQLTVTK